MSVAVLASEEQDFRRIVSVVNQLAQGRSNAVGTVTLTAGATSTVVTTKTSGAESVPLLIPTTANAATAVATTYVSARAPSSFTLTHANTADVDKTFLYVCIG